MDVFEESGYISGSVATALVNVWGLMSILTITSSILRCKSFICSVVLQVVYLFVHEFQSHRSAQWPRQEVKRLHVMSSIWGVSSFSSRINGWLTASDTHMSSVHQFHCILRRRSRISRSNRMSHPPEWNSQYFASAVKNAFIAII